MILCSTEKRWCLKGEWDLGRFISDGRCNSMSCANEKDLEEGRWMLQRGKGGLLEPCPWVSMVGGFQGPSGGWSKGHALFCHSDGGGAYGQEGGPVATCGVRKCELLFSFLALSR